jgi:hypothetical protein
MKPVWIVSAAMLAVASNPADAKPARQVVNPN